MDLKVEVQDFLYKIPNVKKIESVLKAFDEMKIKFFEFENYFEKLLKLEKFKSI